MARAYVLQTSREAVHLRIDYAAELNPQQLAAVTAPPGPALVLAGAGAGKTRTLVYRVAYLIEQGVPPEGILLLTFTNKAAREMMQRVAALLGQDPARLWGGTFHSIGHRLLRRHAETLGYRRDFTVLDREDARDLVKACLGEAEMDVKATRFPKADVLCDLFSLAVNTGRSLARVIERRFPHFQPLTPQIEDLARRYAERKRATNVVDFDDLLGLWLQLLREHPPVREHYQRRFQHLLVDEYQDTNHLQGEIVDLLAAGHHCVMAVGDDSQSIYSWRGADFRNILNFPQRHPGAAIFRIETNYRSTPEILALANAAIAANVHQHPKELRPVRPPGMKPALVVCGDAYQQAAFVAQRALELREEGVPLDRIAVLYRSHYHAMELQMELTKRNLPFAITSGVRFFEQAHLKDVAAFLRLVCNPRDELAFKRLACLLPGIGPKAADKLWTALAGRLPAGATAPVPPANAVPDDVASLWNPEGDSAPAPAANSNPPDTAGPAFDLARELAGLAPQVPKKAASAWGRFVATFARLETPAVRRAAAAMIGVVLEEMYADYLRDTFTNAEARLEDLEQLAAFARQFESPEELLAQLALLTNVEAEAETPARDSERLRLSTIHQAKGLEFAVVFVIMLCEGLFPSARSLEDAESEEEERRLFYVAVTRARDELYLCYPLIRTAPAHAGDYLQQPSRFLGELSPDLYEEWQLRVPGTPQF